jgi:hypothetical protein
VLRPARGAALRARRVYHRSEEDTMHLNLTEHETDLLHGLLADYLPALCREVARTEQRDLRHVLVERQELVERLVEQLGGSPAA